MYVSGDTNKMRVEANLNDRQLADFERVKAHLAAPIGSEPSEADLPRAALLLARQRIEIKELLGEE